MARYRAALIEPNLKATAKLKPTMFNENQE
jgi:hypothetical protein